MGLKKDFATVIVSAAALAMSTTPQAGAADTPIMVYGNSIILPPTASVHSAENKAGGVYYSESSTTVVVGDGSANVSSSGGNVVMSISSATDNNGATTSILEVSGNGSFDADLNGVKINDATARDVREVLACSKRATTGIKLTDHADGNRTVVIACGDGTNVPARAEAQCPATSFEQRFATTASATPTVINTRAATRLAKTLCAKP